MIPLQNKLTEQITEEEIIMFKVICNKNSIKTTMDFYLSL